MKNGIEQLILIALHNVKKTIINMVKQGLPAITVIVAISKAIT